MDKWISLVDNGGDWNCLLNMAHLTKIFMDESHNEKIKSYFIVFRDEDKSQGHVTFSSREKRDSAASRIKAFIVHEDLYFIQISTDIV